MSEALPEHEALRRLLGAWALRACSSSEREEIARHLEGCPSCAAEAERLRRVVELLHPHMDLDLPPALRAEVLGTCFAARSPQVEIPEWARPFDAETARLDALLNDMNAQEWRKPVQLAWREEDEPATRHTTVEGVLGHLLAVDAMVGAQLGLTDPVPRPDAETRAQDDPSSRTERLWRHEEGEAAAAGSGARDEADPGGLHERWREHTYELIRTCSYGQGGVADIGVPYGPGVVLPLRLALLDRAFETWIHATDIADAVNYPYPAPVPEHLSTLIGVAVQMLPSVLAARRQAGLASPPLPLIRPGADGRSVRLEIRGESGGDWYLPIDAPDGPAGPDNCVGHVVLPEVAFCRLAAGHLSPRELAEQQVGDVVAATEILYAMASMSRL
ncbi:zf-HC2 domain-containing protein [Streptomyces sp. NPDC088785]|uniref:zf-HC2 domain-containing protein n=1 Tax=Streptomyces sp. NPDC088785 TaxID=3365897 RepID=UPI003814DD05